MRRVVAAFVWIALAAPPASAVADQSSAFYLPALSDSKLLRHLRVEPTGRIRLAMHFAIVFGGIKQGSGIAAGPAVIWGFKDGGYLQVTAGFSVKEFKLLQAEYAFRPFFDYRSVISTRVRWQDAPELPLYASGSDSPNRHLDIEMTKAEWSASLRTRVKRRIYVWVGSGVEGYSSKTRTADVGDDSDRLGTVPDAPGLGTRPWYVRSVAAALYDTRGPAGYSRKGRMVDANLWHYHDVRGDAQSFQWFNIGLTQLVPTFFTASTGPSERDYRGAFRLFGRVWMTHTGDGQHVPVYLMPYLGGGDYLRGYSSYRFHDRNALLIGTEYRYGIHPLADLAVLLEAGTVAPSPAKFSLNAMAGSAAIGVRVHVTTSGLLRADVAHGRDGFRFAVGINTAY